MMRKALAWAVLATFVGAVVEDAVAGPFTPPKWWRAPLTGSVTAAGYGVTRWAIRQLEQETAGGS